MQVMLILAVSASLGGCANEVTDPVLFKNTYVELVDWHISGLWIVNSPVAWVRVKNYNTRPIKDIVIQYKTYTSDGKPLNEGTYPIEYEVHAGEVKNFAELYLGLVDLETEKLSIKLLSVSPG
jgi:hypothetical protein